MRWFLALFIPILGACAGGTVKVGDECSDVGSTAQCNEGAICGDDRGVTVCMDICEQDEDCASVEECAPVEGSTARACRPRPDEVEVASLTVV